MLTGRCPGGTPTRSRPCHSSRPDVSGINPAIVISSVDFPPPEGLMIATRSAGATDQSAVREKSPCRMVKASSVSIAISDPVKQPEHPETQGHQQQRRPCGLLHPICPHQPLHHQRQSCPLISRKQRDHTQITHRQRRPCGLLHPICPHQPLHHQRQSCPLISRKQRDHTQITHRQRRRQPRAITQRPRQ